MIYEPDELPDAKDIATGDIHHEINNLTSDGFDGITALDGIVHTVVGSLTDDDISKIESYLGVSISKRL